MAANWISLSTRPDDPKIRRLEELTGRPRDEVYTAVLRWFFYVDDCFDAEETGLKRQSFLEITQWKKQKSREKSQNLLDLCAGMCHPQINWLSENPDGTLKIIGFDSRFSSSAKSRAKDARRKRNVRSGTETPIRANHCRENVQQSTDKSPPENANGNGQMSRKNGQMSEKRPPETEYRIERIDTIREENRNIESITSSPPGNSEPNRDLSAQRTCNTFVVRLLEAFGLRSHGECARQRKPFFAVARQIGELPPVMHDWLSTLLIDLARELANKPGLANVGIPVWQSATNTLISSARAVSRANFGPSRVGPWVATEPMRGNGQGGGGQGWPAW